MIFVKFYPSDFLLDTADLSPSEVGVLTMMLMYHYKTERPLPTGKALYRLLRVSKKSERNIVDRICERFFTLSEAGLINKRAQKEIEKYASVRAVNQRVAIEREAKKRRVKSTTDRAQSVLPVRSQNSEVIDQIEDIYTDASKPAEIDASTPGGMCRILKANNVVGVNPGHPMLRKLLDDGANEEDFKYAAATGAKNGVFQFAYILKVAETNFTKRTQAKSAFDKPFKEPENVVEDF